MNSIPERNRQDLYKVLQLATKLFKRKDLAERWLHQQSQHFFGYSPAELCLLGNSQLLIEMLEERLGENLEDNKDE